MGKNGAKWGEMGENGEEMGRKWGERGPVAPPKFPYFPPFFPIPPPFSPIFPHFPPFSPIFPHFPPFFLAMGTLWVCLWVEYPPPEPGTSELWEEAKYTGGLLEEEVVEWAKGLDPYPTLIHIDMREPERVGGLR